MRHMQLLSRHTHRLSAMAPIVSISKAYPLWSEKKYFSTDNKNINTDSCDIAIIGGGIMGLNTAYQIARRSNAKIGIFEKYPGVGYGSSGYSSAILRHLYSKETMIKFANDAINQYKNWNQYLKSNDTTGKFVKTGWLLMSQMNKEDAIQNQQKLQKFGVRTTIIDKQSMNERFPQINSDCGLFDNEGNIEYIPKEMDNSTYFLMEEEAGCFEPMDALNDLVSVLKTDYGENVKINYDSEVTDVLHSGGNVKGVKINNDYEVHSKYVINCCGPFYNSIISKLDGLDIKFTLRPVRMQVIYKDTPKLYTNEFLEKYKCLEGVPIPIIVDYFSGIYLRPLLFGQQISCGTVKEEEEQDEVDPVKEELPQYADPEMRQKFLNSMHHRLKPVNGLIDSSKKVHSISGFYTKSDDVNYLIGNTKLDGFIVCNGFSGHGQKCAPSVGSIVAKYITNITMDDDTDVDIEFFSPYRTPYFMKSKNVLA